jgi:hypothetical protein
MRRILWVIDVDDEESLTNPNIHHLFWSIQIKGDFIIEPVYVCSPSAPLIRNRPLNTRLCATILLERALKKVSGYLMSGLTVLADSGKSVRGTLVAHAEAVRADLIVMDGYRKKDLAEELVQFSTVPVLIVSRKEGVADCPKILYATDFDKASRFAFDRLLVFAVALDAQIVLLYRGTENSAIFPWPEVIPLEEFEAPGKLTRRGEAESWGEDAESKGVPVEVFADDTAESLAELVIRHPALPGNSIVALGCATPRGVLKQNENTALRLLREAGRPLWVARHESSPFTGMLH